MNPYFLLLYFFNQIYARLNLSTIIHLILSFIKNVKLLGSLLVPDAKGTIEHQRGGILKVNYVNADSQNIPPGKQAYFLLPYAIPALNWTKVQAITTTEFNAKYQPRKELTEIDVELMNDMLAIGQITTTPTQIPFRKPQEKVSLKHYTKIDVTDFIESVAGPGKDFFGCSITPQQLNPDYKYLIFHFTRKSKTFAANDSLSNLSTK